MREEALAKCKFSDGGKVAGKVGHIKKMQTLQKAANNAGVNITNGRFITKLLNSFPESWDPVIPTIYGEEDLVKVIPDPDNPWKMHCKSIWIWELRHVSQFGHSKSP